MAPIGEPLGNIDEVEYARLEWVACFNTGCRIEPLSNLSAAEPTVHYYHDESAPLVSARINHSSLPTTPGGLPTAWSWRLSKRPGSDPVVGWALVSRCGWSAAGFRVPWAI